MNESAPLNRPFGSSYESLIHKPIENFALHQSLDTVSQSLGTTPQAPELRQLIQALQYALLRGESPQKLIKRIRRERLRKNLPLEILTSRQAEADLTQVKKLRAIAKEHPHAPGTCKLDEYRQEVRALYSSGASQRDIKYWLLSARNASVSQSTIQRYIKKLKANVAPRII
ncbi:MAG: hypothetical protein QM752_07230 [Gammaproteobacteria bacterium]